LLILCATFSAGCIDAIVGGGLIQTPALVSVHRNTTPSILLGTSKFAAVFGTGNAAWCDSCKILVVIAALIFRTL